MSLVQEQNNLNRKLEWPPIEKSEILKERYPMPASWKFQLDVCMSNGKTIDIMDAIYYFILEKEIDEQKLAHAIEEVVKEHPTFQAGLLIDKDEIFIRKEPFVVKISDMDKPEFDAFRKSKLHRVRDLSKDPLFEAEIINSGDQRYVFIDLCHLVYDGVTIELIMHEIQNLYDGRETDKETFSIFDLAEYEKNLRGTPFYQQAVQFLDETYQGLPAPHFFGDATVNTTVSKPLLEGISREQFMSDLKELQTSPLSFYLGALELTVKKLWESRDFAYAVIYNGRKIPGLKNTMGVLAKAVFQRAQTEEITDSVSYLNKVHQQYHRLIQSDVLQVQELTERYPNTRSGITFNYMGTVPMRDHILLAGKKNMGSFEFYNELLEAEPPFTDMDFMIREYVGAGTIAMIASARISAEEAEKFLTVYDQICRMLLEKRGISEILS